MRQRELALTLSAAWNRFWFQPYDPLPAGLFRIAFGALLTLMYAALYPNWDRYFGVDGVMSLNDPGLPPIVEDWWSAFVWLPHVPFRVFWAIGFVAAIAFTVGWLTRVWTIVLLVIETSMVARNGFAINGEDLVGRMLLFYGCFAPLGGALSIDAWLKSRRKDPTPLAQSIWPIRLMQINFALIYVISLPIKIASDDAWTNGEAIYLSVVSNLWGRVPWPRPFYGVLGTISTAFAVLAEGTFPLLVWFSRTRPVVLLTLASLHIGIAVMLKNVTFFSLSMVCAVFLFPSEAEIRAAQAHCRQTWIRFRRLWTSLSFGRSDHGPVIDP
jgi:hypothetical protein